MNKKGFTLVELLAVIVLIGVVATIATVSINGIQRKVELNMFKSKLELALGAVENWGLDNKEYLKDSLQVKDKTVLGKEISVSELMDNEYLSADSYDDTGKGHIFDSNDEDIRGNVNFYAYNYNGRIYSCISKYPSSVMDDIKAVYEELSC